MAKTNSIQLGRTNPVVKALLAATFPAYKGRKIKLVFTVQPVTFANSDWDGGSRTEVRFYNLTTGGVVYAQGSGTACPEGWAIVEHSIFCGVDAGITIRARGGLGEADQQVAIDAILAGRTHEARAIVATGTSCEWGCLDKGHERITALDLAWLAVWTTATEIEKAAKKATTCKPTELNISVLARYAAGRAEFPNQIEQVSAPHMRRCMKAGLIEVKASDVKTLRLTEAGMRAIGLRAAA